MHSRWAVVGLGLAALWPLQALAGPLGLAECRSLRERRNQLASQAMQAEIALVLATRRRLCPQQEALAEQANAGTAVAGASGAGASQEQQEEAGPVGTDATAAGQDGPAAAPTLDYTTYLQCRRQAEQQLRRSRVILYTNQRGFNFYTREGARLGREADGWQMRLGSGCGTTGGT